MDDIDTALTRLARDCVPRRLAETEIIILGRVASYRFGTPEISSAMRTTALAAALIVGIAGGLIPEEPARQTHSLSPIDGAAGLAPSTLLTGRR